MKTNIQRIRDAFPALKWSLYREIQDGVDHVVIVLDSKVVGSTHLLLSPLELIEKLAALVPPPRLSLIRYHGVLAPNASVRQHIVPSPAVAEEINIEPGAEVTPQARA